MTDAFNKWPLVCVRWLDSSSPRGWQPLAEWSGIGSLECVSVGFLFAVDADSKTIIPHFSYPDDDVNRQGNGIMVIPLGAITSIERLSTLSNVSQPETASEQPYSAAAHSFRHS
jgi:hypothetical protein